VAAEARARVAGGAARDGLSSAASVRRLPPIPFASLALAALLASGCARDESPEGSYRALARAVADRDAEAAWSLLSAGSQRWLEGQARRAAAAAPGVVPANARALLLGDAALGARPPAAVSLASSSGDRAVLRVEPASGPAREVHVVREGGRWKVELPPPAGE